MARKKKRIPKRSRAKVRAKRYVQLHDSLVLLSAETGEELAHVMNRLGTKVEPLLQWGETGLLLPRTALPRLREGLEKLGVVIRPGDLGPKVGGP